MTPELKQYLTDWYQWATGDAVDGEPFLRAWGLCCHAPNDVLVELKEQLSADIGNSFLPFGGFKEYKKRFHNRTQYQCPKRLAWVASKIGAA